ncbi:helix-turn-helix domain-containing protein [Marinococcus halophilus]|uniref:Helix-turn-helix domain-containing protein n=1 Tax=Marinococcus halophilus TaxID=1371 RepID=A0A510Y1F1_MARHA|nr:helix-turn-helix domain-containing protein [Marinococcus halophilus]GEK57136.1 hypothetical protein MHA01_00410 [Marinococcus halophilus]
MFYKVDIESIKNGLIKEVGGVKHFAVLSIIASYANDKGEAFPSQDTIGELIGFTRKTVNGVIKDLRSTDVEGEPVLQILQEKTAKGRRNKYVLSQKLGLHFGKTGVTQTEGVVTEQGSGVVTERLQELERTTEQEPSNKSQEQESIVFDNAKDVVNYFRNKYFDKYEETYQPNWGRDAAMIKNKLLKTYTDEEIKTILDTVFSEYDQRWANDKFPRPTIGQLCSWLGNKALGVADSLQKQEENVEAESEKYNYDESHYDALLESLD